MNKRQTTETATTETVGSLEQYLAEGKSFLEACRQLISEREREEGYVPGEARLQIKDLAQLLRFLTCPDEEVSPLMELWIPRNHLDRETRFHNYLLWQSFSSRKNRLSRMCPALTERALTRALRAGRNDFEQKHHLFNMLLSRGFSKRIACLLAKYLSQNNH